MVKNLPTIWETWVQFLGWEDPLEEGTPLQYSWLENPHGQRSLVGYSLYCEARVSESLICMRSPPNCGEGNGTPLQYSCLENPMDGGAR